MNWQRKYKVALVDLQARFMALQERLNGENNSQSRSGMVGGQQENQYPRGGLETSQPGVKTLKTGQVLNTPKFPSGQGVMRGTNKGTTFDESGKGGNVNNACPCTAQPVYRQCDTDRDTGFVPTNANNKHSVWNFGQQPVQSQPNVYIPSSRNLNVNYVVPPVNMTTRVNPVPLTGQQSQQPRRGNSLNTRH